MVIEPERIRYLKKDAVRQGKYILYWMQAAQRVKYNHALDYALYEAGKRNIPLVVYFGLIPDFPGANLRHYSFMMQGLEEVGRSLRKNNIYFALRLQSPPMGAIELSDDAELVVMDTGYLSFQRQWRNKVVQKVSCPVAEVETNVIVPVEAASEKEQYSAATLRRRINKVLDKFTRYSSFRSTYSGSYYKPEISNDKDIPLEKISACIDTLPVDRSVLPSPFFRGGTGRAEKLLEDFLKSKIQHYDVCRNDPYEKCTSRLSPYLHFGQISPLYIYHEVKNKALHCSEGFLEELVVRRELSCNFVYYNPRYENIRCLPQWCRKTLREHEHDKREYLYSLKEFEKGLTHDKYWNAAQMEMVITGKMFGYMRMYWGKKIIEWSKDAETAYKTMIYLNDKYELDGRDPNGYAGVAWCFGKHDRPWQERKVFGKIRYMNDKGLKRKIAGIDKYVDEINELQNTHASQNES